MWIFRNIGMVCIVILTSFYFFPFEFTFLPAINTKMAMAGMGLCLLIVQLAKEYDSVINYDFFVISLWAAGVSLISFLLRFLIIQQILLMQLILYLCGFGLLLHI